MSCSKIRTSEVEHGRFGGKEWLNQCLPSRTRERERDEMMQRDPNQIMLSCQIAH